MDLTPKSSNRSNFQILSISYTRGEDEYDNDSWDDDDEDESDEAAS